jgi:uncharacterized protein YndB with AHSA1/START domain
MAVTEPKRATISLPSDDQILISRHFDAPRHLVYRAYTTPELVRRWWCGRRGEVTTCEIDLRVGGMWRYVLRANAGFEVGFHGVYREIVPNSRLVSTEIYEAMPSAEAVSTVTFADVAGGTLLTILVQHADREVRDAHLASGMEDGMNEAFDLLEEASSAPDGEPAPR